METKLEDLIEKIKADGVCEAERLSLDIENRAKQEAKKIIDNANDQAKKIVERAQGQAQKLQTNATAALQQTARDVALTVREQIVRLFENILNQDISQALEVEVVNDLIVKIVNSWAKDKSVVVEAVVSSTDKEKVVDLLLRQFKDKLKDTIEIKVNHNIDKGFRIGIKGQDLHYDFTNESILDSFKVFLSPAIVKVLNIDNE
ncbi:MAG: hypothetical protein ABIH08_01765 [Candidatus Omnitrophota bacterium]|nr:hypothetical protein [Candidatus Omnitrophota bacterium]